MREKPLVLEATVKMAALLAAVAVALSSLVNLSTATHLASLKYNKYISKWMNSFVSFWTYELEYKITRWPTVIDEIGEGVTGAGVRI